MIIKNASVFLEDGTFKNMDIQITEDKCALIAENITVSDDEIIDAKGLYAIPGLTDLHFHGCVGYDFCDGTHEAYQAIAEYQAKNGITSLAPATMTLGDDSLTKVFENAASYGNTSGASIVGINMEGPYLCESKKGAQNADYLKLPDAAHFRKMNALSGGLIKLVAIAPEVDGAMDFIKELKDEVILSLAHTTADYNVAVEAFESGASHVTHLFNAMPPFAHRDPGVIGAAFDSKDAKVELICDGIHIHPSVIRAVFQLFGDERVILISDSMMATGLDDGSYALGGQGVTVKGSLATLADGTIAGSVTNLMKCMKHAISVGIPLGSAVKAAAVNPAKEIGIYENYGSIAEGKFANIVLMDQELNVVDVILKGKRI